jgi:hypothetical protein
MLSSVIAVFFSLLAAQRLMMWDRLYQKDLKWLNEKFGDDGDNERVAVWYANISTGVYALLALLAAYA